MKKKISLKLISVILAVVMLATAMPVAFAASPVALSASNVTVWPTASGEMHYGQPVGEHITISGGKVEYNGTEVPGKFVHWKETFRPLNASDAYKANLTFVPDDTTLYKGFNKLLSADVTFKVKKTTPVLMDENNPPVATSIKSGQTLSESTISGGTMMNPYNESETGVQNAAWTWVSPETVLTESGEYDAYLAANETSYERVTKSIYVDVVQEIFLTEVSVLPTIEELTYDANITWSSIELLGGIAVINGTDTQVEGSFSIAKAWREKIPTVGSYEIGVVFTPKDLGKYTTVEMKVPVTVNAATVKFVDEAGNEIVPEITIDRVLEVGNDLNGYLRPYLNASCSFNYEETEGYGEKIKPGTHEYTVKTIIDNPNFERYGTLTFKVIANREKINAKVKNVVDGKQIYFEGGDVIHIYGDFDIKCFVDGKETQVIEGVKLNKAFTVNQSKSGVYTYEIIYNAAENDYYDVTVVTEAEEIKLQHSVKINDNEPVVYTYGDMVTITAPAHEKPYYVFTGWANESGITLTDDQRSAESISTTMPDNDIELKANYKFSLKLFFEWIWAQIVQFFNYIINAVKGLFALAA